MAARKKPSATARTLRRLRRQLEEAQSTIDAIRDGHVEALVVRAPGGNQIFTLRSADQPYRLMVEQMREGALTVAEDGTILYCNRRFAELVAWPQEQIAGQNIRRFVEPDMLADVEVMLQARAFRGDVQLHSAAGVPQPVQVSSTALNIDDVRTVAVVVTDLTHEQTERGLRESNRLKDEFLATLSHELRTPLNVILGWTRMLLSDHLTDATRQHALELIDRNAQAQAQLVNDLVDMSRMTTGKLRLDLESLPLQPALETALESVRPAARVKGLTIETALDMRDANVLADATRLQQVLWNILSNAVKFTPAGGRITVAATRAADAVRVEVTDSGVGIDPMFLPHAFDRFRQADNGTTRTHGGLGLGLAIVRELTLLHGGTVDVQSPGVGLGTTFVVTLPTSRVPPRPPERRKSSRGSASLAGHCIMVVEDHEDSRDVLSHVLQESGATVVAFGGAQDAFAALDQVQPSVIVADIGLPGEDGYSFIRRVRHHPVPAIQSVPAIAVTAYAGGADRAEALAVGFQQHLAKPIEPHHLVDTIHEAIRRARHV